MFLIAIPLILTSFCHLWNPVGFPAIWVAEGQYMQRAMSVLVGFDVHGSDDINPNLFRQVFLAGILAMMSYLDLLSMIDPSSGNEVSNTIKVLYFVPRIIM